MWSFVFSLFCSLQRRRLKHSKAQFKFNQPEKLRSAPLSKACCALKLCCVAGCWALRSRGQGNGAGRGRRAEEEEERGQADADSEWSHASRGEDASVEVGASFGSILNTFKRMFLYYHVGTPRAPPVTPPARHEVSHQEKHQKPARKPLARHQIHHPVGSSNHHY